MVSKVAKKTLNVLDRPLPLAKLGFTGFDVSLALRLGSYEATTR